ncbi:YbaL family putative K(+) efflux transporter [Niveispirillum lacus]|nr:YbaL family putative K(+) efflux transporter [Niveispirillum lacus]
MHDVPLITMLVAALALAFIFGAIAQKLKISPLVGYLLAGVMIGPATPGYVGDMELAPQLAEIGVILLMFGVGLHFSVKDLMSVKAIAIPGAIGQIGLATLMGMGLSWALGWSIGAGLVFGLALSVASTVVLLRALQERRLVDSTRGRIAIGWLIVEDLAMVLALVLLPALAGFLGDKAGADGAASAAVATSGADLLAVIAVTLGKVAAFMALMLLVGKRVIPWVLHEVAHSGSRELFRLAVLALALGVAYGAATLFGVSFALGAFFAGMVLAGSPLSHRAAEESLPLRDAFAVLFFVSVGMMFDPAILIERPLPVLATVLIIVLGKSLAAYLIVLAFGHPRSTALTISASLAQIGEFSFILAALGVNLGLLPQEGQDLVLVGAILSILLNPVMFSLIDRFGHRLEPGGTDAAAVAVPAEPTREPVTPTSLSDHAIIIGHGRVGSLISAQLKQEGVPFLVVEDHQERVDSLRAAGVEVVVGNAVLPDVLSALNLPAARLMFIAIPNAFEAGQIIRQTRIASPGLPIIARAHADGEVAHLTQSGASTVVMGERETARGMIAQGLAVRPPPPVAKPATAVDERQPMSHQENPPEQPFPYPA